VGAVGVVYVVGAVKLTGVYKLKTETPTTAVDAVTMAGGAGFEAISDKAEIVRTIDGKRTEVPFDYRAALKHLGPDPVLMADDIVFIPTDTMRAALKGGGLGIAVALASAFLYHY
jgi:polysaccharide export outer membrane protein